MIESVKPTTANFNRLPVFLSLSGRRVLIVGGGPVAASKLQSLQATGAAITLVSPRIVAEARLPGVKIHRRAFRESDLAGTWLVITAATQSVNAQVARAAERQRIFVNAVDDPTHASAYFGGILHRGHLTIAISSSGHAPSLVRLLREALEQILPDDLSQWLELAKAERESWLRDKVEITDRTPLLAAAIGRLYPKD